jgi:hypothetical protein
MAEHESLLKTQDQLKEAYGKVIDEHKKFEKVRDHDE